MVVEGELAALVGGQSVSQFWRELEQLSGEGIADRRRAVAVGKMDQHDVAADPLDEGADSGAHVGADGEIAFPVADRATPGHVGWSLVE